MHHVRLFASTLLLVASATALGAQGPGRPPGMPPFGGGPGGGNALGATAEFLLSHTGELRLSDNQVVRLASIARRSADRRRAMRDSLEDMRPPLRGRTRGDSLDRDERRADMERNAERMRSRMERMREDMVDDRRDAIAVLNADQQAQAWELVASRGPGPGFGRGMRGFGPGGARSGGPGQPGARLRQRPDGERMPAAPGGQRQRRPGEAGSEVEGQRS